MLRGFALTLIFLMVAMTSIESHGQIFPRPGQNGTQNPGLPDADKRKAELELLYKISSSRMGIKNCVDQLALTMKDDLMTEVANQVRARFYTDAWVRLTQYYMGAGLDALYHLEEKLNEVAASASPSCHFYSRPDSDKTPTTPTTTPTNPFPVTTPQTFDQMQ